MHRLKEWFGVKDWYGPQQSTQTANQLSKTPVSSSEQEKDANSSNAEEKAISSESLPVKNVNNIPGNFMRVTVSDKQNPVWFGKTEQWLKQYIPHKEGTCFGCKLVAMGTVLAYSVFAASLTITQFKKFNSNYRKLYVMSGVSATLVGLTYLGLLFNDQSPLDAFQPKNQENQK